MKAKVKASGEIIEVSLMTEVMYLDTSTSGIDEKVYYESDLEFLPDNPEEVTIEGYVARDKDKRLRLHYTMPQRQSFGYWQGDFKSSYLPDSLLPEVTWDSEPLKVKLTLTPME